MSQLLFDVCCKESVTDDGTPL